MVIVKGTHGPVTIEVKGIREVQDNLRRLGIEISNQKELKLVQAGNFLQQEVQESIIGNRAEKRSVDTGRFANSIQADALNLKQGEIKVKTNVEYAQALEYGTVKLSPRMHFRNSLFRSKSKIREFLGEAVKLSIKVFR